MTPSDTSSTQSVDTTISGSSQKWDRIVGGCFYALQFLLLIACIDCIGYVRALARRQLRNIAYEQLLDITISWTVGPILCILAAWLAHYSPMEFLHLGTFGTAAILTVCGILMTIAGSLRIGLLLGIIAAILVLVYWFSRDTLPMSAHILRTVTACAGEHKGLYILVIVATAGLFIYMKLMLGTFKIISIAFGKLGLQWPAAIALVTIWLWTQQVISNYLRTVTAAVFTHFLTNPPTDVNAKPLPITWRLARKALVKGMNSICMGSSLVLPISLIRTVFYSLTGFSTKVKVLSGQARNYNYFAFNRIAESHISFREASNLTWDHMYQSGIIQVYDGNYIGLTVTLVFVSVAMLVSLGEILAHVLILHKGWDFVKRSMMKELLVNSIYLTYVFMVIEAGMLATLVVLAENPAAVRRRCPNMYNSIIKTYPQLEETLYNHV
jgi:hypothetical protein